MESEWKVSHTKSVHIRMCCISGSRFVRVLEWAAKQNNSSSRTREERHELTTHKRERTYLSAAAL